MKYMKTYNVAPATIHSCSASEKESLLSSMAEQKHVSSNDLDPEKDLLKIVSILVSTGKNKNDDVFIRDELAPARTSGKNKPLNVEHDSDKIIGHMTRSFLTDKKGNEITDETITANFEAVPEDFDITNEAVVYAFVKPTMAETLKKMAAAGKLFVSVEMWFTDFDFLVGTKIIKRNQATAFLDENLRANGGDGVYKGETVARVLRHLLIGGIGVVEKPANPESIVKSIAALRSESSQDVHIYSEKAIANNIIGDLNHKSLENKQDREDDQMKKLFEEMAETVKASTEAAVKKALEDKASAEPAAKEDKEATEASTVEDKVSENDNSQKADVPNENIQALTATVNDLTKTVKSQSEELESLRQERSMASRRQALKEVGLNDEDVQRRMAKATSMTKQEFDIYAKDLQDLFNSYLKGENVDNESTEQGGEKKTEASKEENAGETEAKDDKTDKSEASEDNDSDTVIDMNKLEGDDDLGLGESEAVKSADSLADRFEEILVPRLASRNKAWRKMQKSENGDKE